MSKIEKRMIMTAAGVFGLFVFLIALFSAGCDGHQGQRMEKAFVNVKGEGLNPTVVCK